MMSNTQQITRKWAKRGLMAGFILFWVWIFGFVLFLIAVTVVRPDADAGPSDAIIVVTGGQNRVNTGLDLLADNKSGLLFISGVNDKVKIEELVRMWRADFDFIPCCIILGHAAHDTEGNARESSAWIRRENIQSYRLVTSNYHMPRAWLEFRHALPNRQIIAHPIRPSSIDDDSKHFLGLSFGEYNKTILTWIRLYLYPWDQIFKKGPAQK